jgi:hypothetical protein
MIMAPVGLTGGANLAYHQKSGVWNLCDGKEVQCEDTNEHGDDHENYGIRGLCMLSCRSCGSVILALTHRDAKGGESHKAHKTASWHSHLSLGPQISLLRTQRECCRQVQLKMAQIDD